MGSKVITLMNIKSIPEGETIDQKVSQFLISQPVFIVLATASVYAGTYTDRLYPLGRFLEWGDYLSIALSGLVPIILISIFFVIILYTTRKSRSLRNNIAMTSVIVFILYIYLSIGFLSHAPLLELLVPLWARFALWGAVSLLLVNTGNILYFFSKIGPWAHAVIVLLAAVNTTAHLASERGRLDAIGYHCTMLKSPAHSGPVRIIFRNARILSYIAGGQLYIEEMTKDKDPPLFITPMVPHKSIPSLATAGELGGVCVE